jgi:anti-anti-sigma factor
MTLSTGIGGPNRGKSLRRSAAVTEQLATGWHLELTERGPDWLFIRLHVDGDSYFAAPHIADQVWSILRQHFVYRVVLEMDEVAFLSSHVIGQLVMLQKRVLQQGGALRICGLSPSCQEVLRICRLITVLPAYASRADAVLGRGLVKPR